MDVSPNDRENMTKCTARKESSHGGFTVIRWVAWSLIAFKKSFPNTDHVFSAAVLF